MAFIVPPGGFKGFAQMTPASQRALSTTGYTRTPSQIRKSKRNVLRARRKDARALKKIRRAKAKKGGMKFGSPAWQKKYKVGKYRK